MPPKGSTAKAAKHNGTMKQSVAASSAEMDREYSTSSSTSAASAPKLDHLPGALTIQRTNSMTQTHALKGGVRSTARLCRPNAAPLYTRLYYKGEAAPKHHKDAEYEAEKATEVDRPSQLDEMRLSSGDAEVSVIKELQTNRFSKYLSEVEPGQRATLEFHGNHGPCDGCKERITTAVELLRFKMYKDTTLQVYVYYSDETSERTRGVKNVKTLYGYPDGVEIVRYHDHDVYRKNLGIFAGTANREVAKPNAAAAQPKKSSSNTSTYRNSFEVLGNQTDDESADNSSDEAD